MALFDSASAFPGRDIEQHSLFSSFYASLGFYGFTSFLVQSPESGVGVTCLYLAMLERIVMFQYLVQSAYMLEAKF